VYLLGSLTETNVILDPVATDGKRRVSAVFTDAKVARAIQGILRSAKLECVPLDDAIFVTNKKDTNQGVSVRPQELPEKIREAFAKTVSFDFVECPLADALPWLSKKSGVEFRTGPGIDVNHATLSLRLLNIRFQQAFAWILRVKGYGYRVEGDEAIRLLSKPEK
jgi:type II secretory pathway component HofQ